MSDSRLRQTVRVMNSKMLINKKGSYLVEAAIALPVFIIAVMVMSSVILMYACIEDCSFIAANELRRGAAEAVMADTSIALPYRIRREIENSHSQVYSARLTDSGFRCRRWGVDELLIVNFRLRLKTNPVTRSIPTGSTICYAMASSSASPTNWQKSGVRI